MKRASRPLIFVSNRLSEIRHSSPKFKFWWVKPVKEEVSSYVVENLRPAVVLGSSPHTACMHEVNKLPCPSAN